LHTGTALLGAVQITPHCPQLEVSVVRSTHEPSQLVRSAQSVEQTPERQTVPGAHAVAQSPQCWRSDRVSTQRPEQLV
jgi:hypothetical protein